VEYLNKTKIKTFLPFFLGFFLSFSLIAYKFFFFNLTLDPSFESLDYIRPAKVFFETQSFELFLESLRARGPTYPLLISFLFKIFGENTFISILFFQSILNGLLVHCFIKIKNIFFKDYFYLSLIIIVFNLNILLASTTILPDFLLLFFLTNGIYFYLKFFKKKGKLNLIIGNIFFGLAFITKPVGILLPFFLFLALIIFFIFQKKVNIYNKILLSLSPLLIIYLIASPVYTYHYKESGVLSFSFHKGGHLLHGVYPCLSNKWGCGQKNKIAREKAKKIAKDVEDNFFKNKYKILNSDFDKENFIDTMQISQIHEKEAFKLIKEIKTTQIIQSAFFSYMKLTFHTSLIGFIDLHNINYDKYKITSNFNKITFIWLVGQIALIISRFFQIYGIFYYLKSNKKNSYSIIFLLLICIAFLIPALSIGNYRYRLPIEIILSLLTILGVRKFIKNHL